MQGTSYTIRVTVTSLLGISNTADWTFSRKSSGSTPVITFLSGSEVPFKIAEGVKVAVQLVADSVCSGKQVGFGHSCPHADSSIWAESSGCLLY